jgi:methylglyoxal synthase
VIFFLCLKSEPPMRDKTVSMTEQKSIAIVAHDNKKQDLLAWAKYNRKVLCQHRLIATGTTGKLLRMEIELSVTRLQRGPLGGDEYDPDVKALLRIAVVWNIACIRTRKVTPRRIVASAAGY